MAVRRCSWRQRGSTTADPAGRASATPVPGTGCRCQNEAGAAVLSGCARPATSRGRQLWTARVRRPWSLLSEQTWAALYIHRGATAGTLMPLLCVPVCKAEPRGVIARRVTEVAQSTLDMVSSAVDYPLCECLQQITKPSFGLLCVSPAAIIAPLVTAHQHVHGSDENLRGVFRLREGCRQARLLGTRPGHC